jgi:hypothetical protein
MTVIRSSICALGASLALLVAGCGGGASISVKEPGPPVGEPQLPDIAPAPALDAHMSHENGRWLIRFSSILVNIGDGDFVLRAERGGRDWTVVQDVPYSESGAKSYPTPAQLVWGGDGHNHWHVERVATNWLVPIAHGKPVDEKGIADAKVGFCFYDFSRQLDDARQEAQYSRFSCGNRDDTAIGMGLSWGWADVYPYGLPGQSIDVTKLPDRRYRLWTEADRSRWFHEARRDNNVTWVDLALSTRPNGVRASRIVRTGPVIRPGG